MESIEWYGRPHRTWNLANSLFWIINFYFIGFGLIITNCNSAIIISIANMLIKQFQTKFKEAELVNDGLYIVNDGL